MIAIDPHSLTAALTVLSAPLPEILPSLSKVLAEPVPHTGLAMLSGDCGRSPLITHGEPAVTRAEMVRLAKTVKVGRPWSGLATIGGSQRPVLAAATAPKGSAGALLAIIDPVATQDGEATQEGEDASTVHAVVQLLWDLTVVHVIDLVAEAEPVYLTESRVAAGRQARALAESADAHAAALTALLGVLRSRTLDDSAARRVATELAVSALVELRTSGSGDTDRGEQPAGEAFAELQDKLSLIARYSDVAVELIAPDQGDRMLPGDVAHAARATARGAVLTMLQEDVTRIRVAWQVEDAELRVVVRDDGAGEHAPGALEVHRLGERLATLNGTLHADAVPGWGTTLTARIPLAPPPAPDPDPLSTLNPRELDVLGHLARGRRNRQIAEELHISVHTVKFHVGNILGKLGVPTRGEAAAAARDAGI